MADHVKHLEIVQTQWAEDRGEITDFAIIACSDEFRAKINEALESGCAKTEYQAYLLVTQSLKEYR